MNTKEIIEKYFECINTQNWETWLTLFDDHVVIDESIGGHMEGIQSMRDSATGIQQQFAKFNNSIQEIVVEGNKGMVVCHIDAVTSAGVPLESTGVNFYIIDNKKIKYIATFHDKTPFVEAFSQA